MSKSRRNQKPKDMGNRALWDAMQEIRRSSAAGPDRNKTKYRRADYRRAVQRGEVW
jgi:hypothetical protein